MEQPQFKVRVRDVKPYTINITTSDLIQWDEYRLSKGLPPMEDCTSIWSSRIVYTASKREQKIEAGMPYQAFVQDVEQIEFVQSAEVDPTQKDLEVSS